MSTKTRQRIIIGLIIVAIAGAAAYFLRDKLFGKHKMTDEDEDRPIIIRTDGAITNQPFNVYYNPQFKFQGVQNELGALGPELYSLVIIDRTSTKQLEYSRLKPDCEVATILSPGTPNPTVTVVGQSSGPMIIKFSGLKPESGNTCNGCRVVRVTCTCCTGPLKDYQPSASQAPVSVIVHQ
jgi:hypothetical protein